MHGSSESRAAQGRTPHQRARIWIWLSFTAAILLLSWATIEAYRQSRTTTEDTRRVHHTLQVLNTALQLETTLLSMESEHRGYLVRGDAAFAEARDQHARSAAALLGTLRALVADNPAQTDRLRDMDPLLEARHDAMRESTRLLDAEGIDTGRESFRPQGEGSIQPLRVLLAELRQHEESLLEARSRRSVETAQRLRWALLYGPGVGLLIVLFGFLALMRQLDRTDRIRRHLVAANALQNAMLESAGHMIIACATDGRITLFNRAASDALGYAPDAVIGKATPLLFHDQEEVAQHALALGREFGEPVVPGFEALVARPLRGLQEERIWTYVRREGGRFPVQLVVSTLRDERGELLGFIGMAQDITARFAAEHDIRVLNDALLSRSQQLEESVRDLESFSYSVSHDLRAPLRHIDGYARMLQEDAGDTLDTECRRYLNEIGTSSRRMGRLIDDLLALSRLGRMPLKHVAVDMNALVRDACLDLDWGGRPQSVIEFSILPSCMGDSALLRQVWVNLLSNALKYTVPRGSATHIRVAGTRDGERVRYSVADNGVGFDMRYVDKLFGVFQRLHAQDEFEGTGIGLAIVRRVITRHGGSVSAHGTPGAGAEFCFELPMEEPA